MLRAARSRIGSVAQLIWQGACESSHSSQAPSALDNIRVTIPSLRYFDRSSTSRGIATSSFLRSFDGPPDGSYVTLNNLRDNDGASKKGRRVGRGIGSSKGKTAGRGHKGQKARSGGGPKPGFEGGQTPMRLRVPKVGFHNPFSLSYHPLNLDRLQEWVASERLDTSRVITMRDLRDSGAVSQVSQSAKEAIEKAGGSVKTVYYNPLGLRALLRPEWFAAKGRLLPRPARPPPKMAPRFDAIGELPPKVELPSAAQTAP